jgi:hypothetical protein
VFYLLQQQQQFLGQALVFIGIGVYLGSSSTETQFAHTSFAAMVVSFHSSPLNFPANVIDLMVVLSILSLWAN